jgi:hypothetical protein
MAKGISVTVLQMPDLLKLANGLVGNGEHVSTIKAACETIYGHGVADDVSGNVEAPTGHFYRVAQWIVVTDSQGFSDLYTYASEEEAVEEFNKLDAEYAKWWGDDSP